MLFNSVLFITLFLPLALSGWFILLKCKTPVFAKIFLIGMSFWFYGYYNLHYLSLLLISILFNYIISWLMKIKKNRFLPRVLLITGIAGNLGLLFYFKYFNFFIENCNFFLHTDFHVEKILLPLGISFFTFQQLSFILDRFHGTAPHYSLEDYCFFVSFFPQLVAGPIVLHSEVLPRLKEPQNLKFNAERFYAGFSLFTLGLAKKVLLADSLAVLVNLEYKNVAVLDIPSAWAIICFYMMELYFDFSGYCDMARGIGKMFGILLPENFDSPFRATLVRDFWRRWHMTLSRFLSQYIYIPLGGNRKGKIRQCVNLFIVFLVSGIWHGANWTFIVWGIMHGVAVVFEVAFPKVRFRQEWLNRLVTSIFITLSFSIFRSDTLKEAIILWKRLFAGGFTGFFVGMCNNLWVPENYALIKFLEMKAPQLFNVFYVFCFLLLGGISIALINGKKAEQWIEEKGKSKKGIFLIATLFTWAFISLSRVSVFLYFNF